MVADVSLWQTLKGNKDMTRNLQIMVVLWSFGSFAFFLVPYYLESLSADLYVTSLASELAELLASVMVGFIANCIELKKAMTIFCMLICVMSAAIWIFKLAFPEDDTEEPSDF